MCSWEQTFALYLHLCECIEWAFLERCTVEDSQGVISRIQSTVSQPGRKFDSVTEVSELCLFLEMIMNDKY